MVPPPKPYTLPIRNGIPHPPVAAAAAPAAAAAAVPALAPAAAPTSAAAPAPTLAATPAAAPVPAEAADKTRGQLASGRLEKSLSNSIGNCPTEFLVTQFPDGMLEESLSKWLGTLSR